MPFLNKAGSILRQTANKQLRSELSPFRLSIHQAIRCTSSMASSEALRGSLYQTDEQTLRKAFAKSGEVVDAKTVTEHDTGGSRGLGFIPSSAIQALDGQELHGHRVRLNYATDRPHCNFGGGCGGYTGGLVGYGGRCGYGVGGGYGLRSYGSGAGDKILSTGNSSNNGAGVGSAVNSTIGSADNFGVGQRNSFSSGAIGNTGGGYEIAYTSSGTSTANEQKIVPNTLRPLSPHLPVYKPQRNSTFSILDRISASYLTALIFVYYLVCLKMGPICFTFEYFYKFLFYSANLVPLSLELSAVALAYHTYCGIRHLSADFKGLRFLRFAKK